MCVCPPRAGPIRIVSKSAKRPSVHVCPITWADRRIVDPNAPPIRNACDRWPVSMNAASIRASARAAALPHATSTIIDRSARASNNTRVIRSPPVHRFQVNENPHSNSSSLSLDHKSKKIPFPLAPLSQSTVHRPKSHRSHACHRRAAQTLCAASKTTLAHAVVCPSITVIRTSNVVPNAS